jgi:hypothetical protein
MRIDEMKPGQRFIDTHGDEWVRGAPVAGAPGAYKATRQRDGFASCFAGCADLAPVVTLELARDGNEDPTRMAAKSDRADRWLRQGIWTET